MQLEHDHASGLELLCTRIEGSRQRPRAILGCTYPFDGSIFVEALDKISQALQIEQTDLARIPIDVVCDRNLYRGHKFDRRYRVHPYPDQELFHPKLLIVLLENYVVWLSGSANLTRAGYCANREIMMLHDPGDLSLPAPLRRLLGKLPGDAAQVVRTATVDGRRGSLRSGRFVSSMDGPIGDAFLARAPRGVETVHVLAPFFEQAASVDPIDQGWLERMRKRFPDAEYRFYLPRLESGHRPCVQGDRTLFEAFANALGDDDLVRFFPVPPDPGPLHGKLVAIAYRRGQSRRARILVGSPNPSRRALLSPRRNVEVAWLADIKVSSLTPFIEMLDAGQGRSLDAVRFEAPRRSSEKVWAVLSSAVLDPSTRRLRLTWLDGHGRNDTDLIYGKRRLSVRPDGCVHEFEMDDVHGGLATKPARGTRIKGRVIAGHCPIEVPLVDHMLLGTLDDDSTPEDWLKLLGADPGGGRQRNGGVEKRKQLSDGPRKATQFAASEVRDLAARLRHTYQRLAVDLWSDADRDATLRVLCGIFDSHQPGESGLSAEEQVWRAWVRVELVQFLASAAKEPEVRRAHLAAPLRKLAREFKKNLEIRDLPSVVQKQLRLLVQGLA